jgi:transcriptional regulatory protein RtcR
VERVAVRSRAPVLFTGPTGAGKSHLARRLFELKKARHLVQGEFVEVNCATLRGDGAASTLFGHKKGAFTGAAADRAGLLRAAHEGVLFLDEIGELGLDEQAMLLKAVEEKRFFPMGSDREVASDFQLVAGTNRDLRREVQHGRFRDDLYARINLWSYQLSGLAERPEDIEPNVDHLLARAGTAGNVDSVGGARAVRFNAEAKAAYLRFAQSGEARWAGNFRDLSASVMRLATLAEGGRIGVELVQAEMARLRWQWAPMADEAESGDSAPAQDAQALLGDDAWRALDLFDRIQLEGVLAVCRRARTLSDAGRTLYQASREQRSVVNDADRLRKYLMRFGLSWEQVAR